MTELAWPELTPCWRQSDGAADCIRLRLDRVLAAAEPWLMQCLPGAERARAAEYHGNGARLSFVAGRAALRAVLGAACGVSPCRVALAADDRGALLAPGSGLHVSVAHGGDWVLLALSREPVGIDVEPVAEVPEWKLIASDFHPADRARLASEPTEHAEPFLRCWTRKEAIGKAMGIGLGLAPDACALGCDPAAAPVRVVLDGDWFLTDVDPDSRHLGSAAWSGGGDPARWSLTVPLLLRLVGERGS